MVVPNSIKKKDDYQWKCMQRLQHDYNITSHETQKLKQTKKNLILRIEI